MYGDYKFIPQEGMEIQCRKEPENEEEWYKVYEWLIDEIGSKNGFIDEEKLKGRVN
jgi:hypothetical protein